MLDNKIPSKVLSSGTNLPCLKRISNLSQDYIVLKQVTEKALY